MKHTSRGSLAPLSTLASKLTMVMLSTGLGACAVHRPSLGEAVATPAPASVTTQEEQQSAKAPSEWGYQGESGPYKWGEVNANYALCRDGKQQSPVDLRWVKPHASHQITFHYQSAPLEVADTGHALQVSVAPGSWVAIDGHRFDLQQVQFHSQSEHTLSGKNYALEAQFVHRDEAGKAAMIGVFFKEGKANEAIENLWAQKPAASTAGTTTPAAAKLAAPEPKTTASTFDPINLIPKITTHYSYLGSLTAPPCTEGVNWNVMNTPLEVSKQQLANFRKVYAANYRPVQPLHGRQPANY